jgi:sulfate adenylyltransferase large subunit
MSDLLHICTAGSVDDGKSTLIGRLLYESRGVYEDQVRSVEAASQHRGVGPIDFSLFTDGLKAEREQGITIDVAYRYFATARRKFILADTPGHEQYTRNMATGASTADVAILLADARYGVRPQSRHHARIARLLGITEFVVAVNKLDLVDFDRGTFDSIAADFAEILGDVNTHAVPISALHGDNVTTASRRTPWYDGPGLLGHLETVQVTRNTADAPFRYPVQLVLRPNDGFRGYAGRIVSGRIRVSDTVRAWPSGRATGVARIVTRDGDLATAQAPMSVVLTLTDELDLSRGDSLAVGDPYVGTTFDAHVVWMDERPLDPRRAYRLKHTTRTVAAEVDGTLQLNEIGVVTVTTSRPLIADSYGTNRATGSFVLIDADSNFTAGAGMIIQPVAERRLSRSWRTSAEQVTAIARDAPTDADATEAVLRALEELLR